MKYLSLTALIVMSTVTFATHTAMASLSKLGQPGPTQQCKAASKACAQKRADCKIEEAPHTKQLEGSCISCRVTCFIAVARCVGQREIVAEVKRHGEFCDKTILDSHLASKRSELQTIIRGNIINLLGDKEFRGWPKENIKDYNSENPQHLMKWAEAILEQHEKKLFTEQQDNERRAFGSLTQDEKVGQIYDALKGNL